MTNQSLVKLAETIADNKFILGDRLVEIGVSGPNLEATLSSIAMAQAELGQARLMYKWAYELKGLNGSKVEIKNQTGKAFPSVVNSSNWISVIAGVYAVNLAVNLVMNALTNGNNPEIKAPFSKMFKEMEEHLLYSKNWSKQLLNDKGAVPKTFLQELEKVKLEILQWLNKIENDNLLITEKLILDNSNLVISYKETIENLTTGDVQHV
jgi:ring-1,2-phenylacetyl-CoA epoxidase subunit PaaC